MYFKDHAPPHFHVLYNEFEAAIRIGDLRVVEGKVPTRVLALTLEWANLHRDELAANWESLMSTGKTVSIPPLE